ncbi:MAG: NADH-quinone oxidoreductase subunit C, partial [Vicinamibacterales bacterium]
MTEEPKDPKAAGDKPASETPGEPLKGEVSAAAPTPPAPVAVKPAAPAAAKPAAHDTKPAPPSGPTDPPPPAGVEIPAFIAALQTAVPGAVTQISFYVGDWAVIVPATKLLEVGRFLRETPEAGFDFCSDVTASDWPTRAQRFDVIYSLFSTR